MSLHSLLAGVITENVPLCACMRACVVQLECSEIAECAREIVAANHMDHSE